MKSIVYGVIKFNQLRNISFGLYDFDDMLNSTSNYWKENITSHSIRFCMNRFKQCIIDPSQRQYTLNIDTEDGSFFVFTDIKKTINVLSFQFAF